MVDTARIPRLILQFHIYYNNAYIYLTTGTPTNAARIGLPAADTTLMLSIYTQWNGLMAKYSDKANGRTTAVIEQLNLLIEKFINYDRTTFLLDRIASSPTATVADLEVFNIKKGILRTKTHTIRQTPISEGISVTITPLGGSQIGVKCRMNSNGRAAMHENADIIEYVYSIDKMPESPEDLGLRHGMSSKASFTLDLDGSHPGKILYIYFRWYDTKHPNLAGPWSVMYTSVIV